MSIEYNSKHIGARIRELREFYGWSQTDLIEVLQKHGGAVGRNTLSNIESGDYIDFKFSFIKAMCEIFNCDTGYLLCEYDERVRSNQDIHDATGLSGQAIDNLARWAERGGPEIGILNYLLEAPDFSSLLQKIERFCLKAEEFDENKKRIRPATEAADESDIVTARRYSAVDLFSKIMNEIYDEDHPEKHDYKDILANVRGFS